MKCLLESSFHCDCLSIDDCVRFIAAHSVESAVQPSRRRVTRC
jgi:hypothetical protein